MREQEEHRCNCDKSTEKIVITVNKNGENKEMEIDLDHNENLMNTLKKMSKKNKCQDFFKDAVIEKNDE